VLYTVGVIIGCTCAVDIPTHKIVLWDSPADAEQHKIVTFKTIQLFAANENWKYFSSVLILSKSINENEVRYRNAWVCIFTFQELEPLQPTLQR
jgi:hypothetical protein